MIAQCDEAGAGIPRDYGAGVEAWKLLVARATKLAWESLGTTEPESKPRSYEPHDQQGNRPGADNSPTRPSQRGSLSGSRSRSRSLEATSRRINKGGTARDLVTRNQKQVSFASPEGVDPKSSNMLLLAAAAWNESRLEQTNLDDTKTLGEPNFCSSDPNYFVPEPIVGPQRHF